MKNQYDIKIERGEEGSYYALFVNDFRCRGFRSLPDAEAEMQRMEAEDEEEMHGQY